MSRLLLAKALSLILALVFPLTGFAADVSAMLQPQGAATVNGAIMVHSTALFSGDRVVTSNGSAGTITIPGSTINIAPQSSAVYGGGNFEIMIGGASVVTSSGLSGKVANLTVIPIDGKAKYNFGQRGNMVMIAALEGKLRISDGSRQMVLNAGKAVEVKFDSEQDSHDNNSGGQGSASTRFDVGNAKAVIVASVVAGLGVGLAFGLIETLTPTAASPIR
jgi:preprotein translocase subunit YajC